MSDPYGQLSPDGRWRWDGRQWIPTGFVGLEPRFNPLAVAAFVCSLAVPLIPLSSIAAVVTGGIALGQMRRWPHQRGFGLAVAGVVIGATVLVLTVIALLFLIYIGRACRNGC